MNDKDRQKIYAERIVKQHQLSTKYRNQVSKYLSGKMKANEVIKIDTTPFALRVIGAKAIPLMITQGVFSNCFDSNVSNNNRKKHTEPHNLPQEFMMNLPDAIRVPLMICKGRKPDTIIVLTDEKGQDDNLIYLSIQLNTKGSHGYINKITTCVEKKNYEDWIDRLAEEDKILAINKEKADQMHLDNRVQYSTSAAIICFDNSIAYTMENVKYPDENSQTEEIRMEQDKKFEIVIDTETTGFSVENGDELLQVSMIDTQGNVLYNEYVRPTKNSSWEDAQAVNGITPEMVAGCQTIEEQMPKINAILSRASKIIGYNTPFDVGFLRAAGAELPKDCEKYDVMAEFSTKHGVWDDVRGRYKWIKLVECAEHYGYDWSSHPEAAHNSLGDCYATLHCYKGLQADIDRTIEYKYVVEQTVRTVVTVKDDAPSFAEQQVWDMIEADAVYFEPQRPSNTVKFKSQTLAPTDKPRLFVDMDGTLARFHDEVRYLERMWEEDFFTDLKPFQELVDGIRMFKQQNPDAEVFILSAAIEGEPPYCKQQKHKWLDRYLPEIDREHRIFTEIGTPKAQYITGGISGTDILIDDYNKGLEEWQRSGGRAVKCINNINHKGLHGKLWEGETIRNSDSPAAISAKLEELCGYKPSGDGDRMQSLARTRSEPPKGRGRH